VVDSSDSIQIDAGGSGLSAAAILRFGGVFCRTIGHNGSARGFRQAFRSEGERLFEIGGDGGGQSFGVLLFAIQGVFHLAGAGSSTIELDLADSDSGFIGSVFEAEVKRQKYISDFG